MPPWFKVLAGVMILFVWAVSCLMSWIHPAYAPPSSVQVAMSILTGTLFGKGVVNQVLSRKSPSGPEDREEPDEREGKGPGRPQEAEDE